MKKAEVLKTLKKLTSYFSENDKALESVDTLRTILESYPDDKEARSLSWDSSFPLPNELQELSKGYAIFSDGACRGNPGPGAWGMMIQDQAGSVILKSSGVEVPTTNNKMELQGIIQGLQGLVDRWVEDGMSDRVTPVFVYSDSKYATEGLSAWLPGWKNRGWKKADGKEPENIEQWKELDNLKSKFENIKFIWVKGHAGHPQNEMCDQMCNQALDEAGF